MRIALPAIFCSLIICKIIPAALLAATYKIIEFQIYKIARNLEWSTYLANHALRDLSWVQ